MSLARDVTTVGSATLISRVLGFVRDVVIAAVLGAGVLADAFFVALQIPNLFRRLLAEGALNAAFVPVWLRRRQDGGERGARRFAEDVLGMLAVALAAIAILCMMFAPAIVTLLAPGFVDLGEPFLLAVFFLRLATPYLAIVGLVAVAAATLNAAGRVGAAAFGPVVYNVAMIAAVAWVAAYGLGNSPAAGTVLAMAIVAAGLLQFIVVGGALLRLPAPPLLPQLSLSPEVRRFFVLMLPGVLAAGIPQFTLIAGTMVASSSPAAVSWLYYAYRLYELPLGLVSGAIAAVMTPAIAAAVRMSDRPATAAAQSRAFEMALGLSLPATVGLAMLAEPIVTALFERGAFTARDTVSVAGALAAITLGIPGHALEKALAAVSFANEDTRTPMWTALAGLATSATAAILLFPRYGVAGIGFAIAACGWVSAVLLGATLMRRQWVYTEKGFLRRMALIVLATVAMGLAVGGMQAFLTFFGATTGGSMVRSLTVVAILVGWGVAIYAGALQLFGVVRIEEFITTRNPNR